jgi:hypothetical protein
LGGAIVAPLDNLKDYYGTQQHFMLQQPTRFIDNELLAGDIFFIPFGIVWKSEISKNLN